MTRTFVGTILALAGVMCAVPALAQAQAGQTALIPVGQLIATGGTLVAGDVTFSNFQQVPAVVSIAPPLDGLGGMGAQATVAADGSVSLAFLAFDPATGAPRPITAGFMQSLAYDVTVTNPSLLLTSVNQEFGPLTTVGFNILTYREPPPSVVQINQFFPGTDDTLIYDNGVWRTGVLYPLTCQDLKGMPPTYGSAPYGCASGLPGGNRSSVSLENFFGILTDNHSFLIPNVGPAGFGPMALDGIAMTFTLAPANTVVTPLPSSLLAIDVAQPGLASVSLAHTVGPDGLRYPGFAPAGGIPVTLTTTDAAALPLPAAALIPQGSSKLTFGVGAPHIDLPTPVTATATYNGGTVQQTATIAPDVPLTLTGVGNESLIPTTIRLGVSMNRLNVSPVTIALSSSQPGLIPTPATLTLPALSAPLLLNFSDTRLGAPVGSVDFPVPAVPASTPVTLTASFNGTTLSTTVVLPKSVDAVKVTKAELVVKNLSLKVEATSTVPNAVLTLYNATTGALVGTMTNTGLSAGGAKYSFQGTVSPVTSLLLKSTFSGTATGAVSQK